MHPFISLILNNLEKPHQENPAYKKVFLYRAQKQQNILNAPILKPLLIVILEGEKIIGQHHKKTCTAGNFIFFTNIQSMSMRNIPNHSRYAALLIEFEFLDFYNESTTDQIERPSDYTIGNADDALYKCLLQFIECLDWATKEIIESRRKEIIQLLIAQGYKNLGFSSNHKITSRKVIEIIQNTTHHPPTMECICREIGMSPSTLYRKLQLEGESMQGIKDKILMGKALHLLQTTHYSPEYISTLVGYASYFRFSQKFKSYFGLMPKELKNTQ